MWKILCIMENFLISNCYIDYNLQMFDLQQKHFMWKWNINGHMSKWHFFWVVLINQESIPIKISFEKQIAVKFKVTETLLNHFFSSSQNFFYSNFFVPLDCHAKMGFCVWEQSVQTKIYKRNRSQSASQSNP